MNTIRIAWAPGEGKDEGAFIFLVGNIVCSPTITNLMHPTSKETIRKARKLRQQQTEAEKLLWYYLRNRRLEGYKFRRQYPIGPFIVDFYCDAENLAIEVDGGGHNEPQQKTYDKMRTEELKSMGVIVIRFWNNEVLVNTEAVLETILSVLEAP